MRLKIQIDNLKDVGDSAKQPMMKRTARIEPVAGEAWPDARRVHDYISLLHFSLVPYSQNRPCDSMSTSREAAADTLLLLEERLRRVDYVLNGDTIYNAEGTPSTQQTGSATARLRALERNLHSLAAKFPTIGDILALEKKHPELFHVSNPAEAPSTLPVASLASLVLAHTQLYHSVSSRLSQLQDVDVPDPASAAKLTELRPRIEQTRLKQDAKAKEFAELRTRSKRVVQNWYEGGVLGMGEQWAEWEERLREAEILVRRREAARKREEGLV